MGKSGPEKESIDSKWDGEEFCKGKPPSNAKEFKSFIEYFIAHEDDKDDRENNIAVGK